MTTDTKTALLDAAERAVRTRGFDAFSYADLGEAAGIRKASVHHHFPTKAMLSAALLRRYSDRVGAVCENLAARDATGALRLRGIVAVYRAALNGGETLCLCIALTVSRESLDAAVVNEIAVFRARMAACLSSVFAAGAADGSIRGVTDLATEAAAALATLEGAQLAARGARDVAVFDAAVAGLAARCGM